MFNTDTNAVQADVYAHLHGDARLAGHAGDRARFMALAGGFGETWPNVGGALEALLAFPPTSTALEHRLLLAIEAELRDATGKVTYHPSSWSDFSPFRLMP